MGYKTQKFNIVLPVDLVKTVDEIAEKEFRNRSELIKEALRRYIQETFQGRIIHARAEEARLGGNYEKALEFIDQALLSYQKEKDVVGFTEGLCSKVLVLKSLYDTSRDRNYLIFAKHTAESAVEIAKESKNPQALALPLENLAKVYVGLGDLTQAVKYFQEAIKNTEENPYILHDRPALLSRMKIEMLLCKYQMEGKAALPALEEEIENLKTAQDPSERDKYAWLALSYLEVAYVLKKDQPKKSQEYLKQAKDIINSDPKFDFLKEKLQQAS